MNQPTCHEKAERCGD